MIRGLALVSFFSPFLSFTGSSTKHTEHTSFRIMREIISLFFLDGTIIIDEHKGALVFGVGVALGALVPRT